MENKLLSIGKASKILGISIDTLRRWEKANILQSFRPSPASKRYYREGDINSFLREGNACRDIGILGKNWVFQKHATTPQPSFYCETSDIFYARLQRMESDLSKNTSLREISSLIVAITGEIGSNSYNHNIGSWPDIPGIFFNYNIIRREITLADRGQGIYKTLKRVIPGLKNDKEALRTAFTKYISGRAPENRGNGLKFVKDIINSNPITLEFQTGNAKLTLRKNSNDLGIEESDMSFHGCIAILNF